MPVNPNEESFLLQTLASIHGAIDRLDTKIDHVGAKMDHNTSAIAEVKGEQVAQGMKTEQVLIQVRRINGTVARHEDELRDIRERHAHDDGRAEGRSQMLRFAARPATWAWGGVIGVIGYLIERKAG